MEENKVLATVAGTEITEKDVDAFIKGAPAEQQVYASHPEFRKQCLEQLIALHMFAALGKEEKLDETDEYKMIIANAEKDILGQLAMRNIMKDATVTAEEVKEYYDTNTEKFAHGPAVHAKHILVDKEDECKSILEKIENGEKTFEDAAKEFSNCPSKAQGGDLGEFSRGQMVKEFEDAAFDAEIGKIVGPVKTQFGFHLIKVEGKHDATTASFEEVKDQIEKMLLSKKQGDVYKAKVEELKAKYLQ